MEEVGKEPRVEEGVLGAQMGMIEYHMIAGGGGAGILDRGWVVMPLLLSISTSTSLHSSARTAFTPCDILMVTPSYSFSFSFSFSFSRSFSLKARENNRRKKMT